jgi:hypothetical protein
MATRMMHRLGRNGKGRLHLALAYLIWTLLPHFHLLYHSHAGGAHFHASFDAAQVSLANRLMDNLEGSGLREAPMAEVGGGEVNASSRPKGVEPLSILALAAGEAGLKAGRDADLHGHFWEDPNLAGMASSMVAALAIAALILAAARAYPSPDLRALRRFPARGPPAFLPA